MSRILFAKIVFARVQFPAPPNIVEIPGPPGRIVSVAIVAKLRYRESRDEGFSQVFCLLSRGKHIPRPLCALRFASSTASLALRAESRVLVVNR